MRKAKFRKSHRKEFTNREYKILAKKLNSLKKESGKILRTAREVKKYLDSLKKPL